jgi:hypothetical protein
MTTNSIKDIVNKIYIQLLYIRNITDRITYTTFDREIYDICIQHLQEANKIYDDAKYILWRTKTTWTLKKINSYKDTLTTYKTIIDDLYINLKHIEEEEENLIND